MSEDKTLSEEQIANLSFEQALLQVEEIVEQLEGSQVGLDESLVRFELAVRLIKHCRQILARAERRVRLLVGEDEEGNPILEEFAEEAVAAEEFEDPPSEPTPKPARRKKRKAGKKTDSDEGALFDEGQERDVPF